MVGLSRICGSMQPYTKPFLPINDQLQRLQDRGLVVTEPMRAKNYLRHIGYYRLSGYWYPLRESETVTDADGKTSIRVLDTFRANSEFSHIVDLYVFDKKLRVMMVDVLERIEVSLRTNVTLQLGPIDPWAYRNPRNFDSRFTSPQRGRPPRTGTRPSQFDDFLRLTDNKAARSKEDFVQHFNGKYSDPLPLWVAPEVWDFGNLSILIGGMRYRDQRDLAAVYGIPRPELFPSWVRTLAFIRNICAHHSRLWNRSLTAQPRSPKPGEIALLDHLAGSAARHSIERFYSAAAIARYFQLQINPTSTWGARFVELTRSFPQNPNLDMATAGFPNNWQDLPLWS